MFDWISRDPMAQSRLTHKINHHSIYWKSVDLFFHSVCAFPGSWHGKWVSVENWTLLVLCYETKAIKVKRSRRDVLLCIQFLDYAWVLACGLNQAHGKDCSLGTCGLALDHGEMWHAAHCLWAAAKAATDRRSDLSLGPVGSIQEKCLWSWLVCPAAWEE